MTSCVIAVSPILGMLINIVVHEIAKCSESHVPPRVTSTAYGSIELTSAALLNRYIELGVVVMAAELMSDSKGKTLQTATAETQKFYRTKLPVFVRIIYLYMFV